MTVLGRPDPFEQEDVELVTSLLTAALPHLERGWRTEALLLSLVDWFEAEAPPGPERAGADGTHSVKTRSSTRSSSTIRPAGSTWPWLKRLRNSISIRSRPRRFFSTVQTSQRRCSSLEVRSKTRCCRATTSYFSCTTRTTSAS